MGRYGSKYGNQKITINNITFDLQERDCGIRNSNFSKRQAE